MNYKNGMLRKEVFAVGSNQCLNKMGLPRTGYFVTKTKSREISKTVSAWFVSRCILSAAGYL